MPIEIERKFLVTDDSWRKTAGEGIPIRQGYLVGEGLASVRVRLAGHQANINIKGRTLGVRRQEFEYPIPVADARILLDTLCAKPLVEKIRYTVWFEGHEWEVDVFEGANAGLVVAEIELKDEHEAFVRPPWVGKEVSDDPRYYNTELRKHPFREWK